MNGRPVVLALLMVLVGCALTAARAQAAEPAWKGEAAYRIVVEVSAGKLNGRESDEMVASLPIDFAKMLKVQGIEGRVQLASLQVHLIDPETGDPQAFRAFDSAASEFDRPIRFDDQRLPDPYPGRVGRASNTENEQRVPITPRPRKGRLFNRLVNSESGRLVWTHTQQGDQPARYAIYFDVESDGEKYGVSPAPWIGDVDVLRREKGEALGGFSHFILSAGDLNGDGLFDLVAGTEKGDLMWFPNRGEKGKPRFDGCHMLIDEEGPIDTGWYGAPFLFDWDNDGRMDVLVGTSGNVIVWWRNTGDGDPSPQLKYMGFVQADGKRLEVPQTPIAEDPANVFKADYYNQPWIGDWDGDGNPDILTGGYATGRIWHYRGVGREENGVPKLQYVGPLEADGEPIDTVWAAAPYAHDFDGDGKLDLVSGSWFWSGIHRAPEPGETDHLYYFRNVGSANEPKLRREPLPKSGEPSRAAIARPTVVDWNDDGLPDLLVSDTAGEFVFLNIGEKSAPRWQMTTDGLTIPWGFTRGQDFTRSWGDIAGKGEQVTLQGTAFSRRTGSPHSPRLQRIGEATVNGQPIRHPGPGYGDDYAYTTLFDWDGDGLADLLWGTHQGNIYLHRKLKDDAFGFAEGVPIQLKSGQRLKVGPPVVKSAEEARDFTILQGSRIVIQAADFDGDGIADLVVADTFGNIQVFLNTQAGGTDTLADGVVVRKMPSRVQAMAIIDWNNDGKPDLLAGGSASQPGMVLTNQSERGKPALSEPSYPLDLPYVFWGPRFSNVDWNGDGDEDLVIHSEFFAFWAERSFLEHGYREAKLVGEEGAAIQRRERNAR